MSRCTIATLTVDRPHAQFIWLTASWLRDRARDLEVEPTNLTEGTFTARRMSVHGDRTMAKLRVHCAGHLSIGTRKRIAKWLRSRADYLTKHRHVAVTSRRGWFRQDFAL